MSLLIKTIFDPLGKRSVVFWTVSSGRSDAGQEKISSPDRGLQRREPGNILSMRRAQPEGRDWIKSQYQEPQKNYEINLRIMNRKLQPSKFKTLNKKQKHCRDPTTGTEAL
jgi:hypothetical protein